METMSQSTADIISSGSEDDEESADPLGDLGDFDNLTDDEGDDVGPTDCPYRVKEKIFFVPIDAFQTPISMGDLPSNVVPADHHNHLHHGGPRGPPSPMLHALSPTHSHQSHQSLASMTSIDRNNKNIHFRHSMDPLHCPSPPRSPPFRPCSASPPPPSSPPPSPPTPTVTAVADSTSKSKSNINSKPRNSDKSDKSDNPYGTVGEIDLDESDSDDGDGLNLINYEDHRSEETKERERNHEKKRSLLALHQQDSTKYLRRHSMGPGAQHNVKGKGSMHSRTIQDRIVSQFHPNEFDICLLVSAPLMIKNRRGHDVYGKTKSVRMHKQSTQGYNNSEALCEYIRSSLPDRLELQQTVRQTLVRHNIRMRYAHFTATCESLQELSSHFGGCKVLQFVGYCCNPHRDQQRWPQLCKSLVDGNYVENCDYVLLETEVGTDSEDDNICCFGKGVWYTVHELEAMLNAAQTQIECIIAMSPQHDRLCTVFKALGYEYVVGVEAPNNSDPFPTTETSAFLDTFYAALLESRSVSRAYYLSLQAALSTRGGGGGSDHDPKYILELEEHLQSRKFIVFDPEAIGRSMGEIHDKSQHEKLPKTNLREPVRPFLGRSKYVLDLLSMLTSTSFVNVTGRELIGRASAVKWTIRYLLQMGFFRGGCFVIDCKLQSRKYQNKSFNECVFDVLRSCGVQFQSPGGTGTGGTGTGTGNGSVPMMNSNTLSPFLDDEEELGGTVPMMNYGANIYHSNLSHSNMSQCHSHCSNPSNPSNPRNSSTASLSNPNSATNSATNSGTHSTHSHSHLSCPSAMIPGHTSSGHYSCRSSAVFPNLHSIHPIDELSNSQHSIPHPQQSPLSRPSQLVQPLHPHHQLQPMPVSTPPIGPVTPILGDPRTSPKSLFEYLDLAPPQHEPCCFVILNMNDWTNGHGPDEVAEWITTASEHLLTQEDSRIIYTSNEPLRVKAVSTLNMKELPKFSRDKLARLFKYFCSDFKSQFAPSEEDVAAHDALQDIFDGLPGMTKRVAQYVRFIIAENSMAEREEEKRQINLDEIAKLYPTSDFATKQLTKQTNSRPITPVPRSEPQHQGQLQGQHQGQNQCQHPPIGMIPKRTSNSLPSQLIGVPPLRQRHLMIDRQQSQTPKAPESFFKSQGAGSGRAGPSAPHPLDIQMMEMQNTINHHHVPGRSTPPVIPHHYGYEIYGQSPYHIHSQHAGVSAHGHQGHQHGMQPVHAVHTHSGHPQQSQTHSQPIQSMNNINTLNMNMTNMIPERAGFLNHAARHQFQPYSPVHSQSKLIHSHHGIAEVILQPPITLQNTCTSPGTLYDEYYIPTTDLIFNESVERPRGGGARKPVEFRRPNSVPAPGHYDSIKLLTPRPIPSLSLVVTSPPIKVEHSDSGTSRSSAFFPSASHSSGHLSGPHSQHSQSAEGIRMDRHSSSNGNGLNGPNSRNPVIMEEVEGGHCDYGMHVHGTHINGTHHVATHRARHLNKSISEDVSNRIGGHHIDIHKSVELDDHALAKLMHRRSSSVPHLHSNHMNHPFRVSSMVQGRNLPAVHSEDSKENKQRFHTNVPSSNISGGGHSYNRSNLLRPGHSPVFSSQTLISLSADSVFEPPPPHSPALAVSNSWHRKNTSYLVYSKPSDSSVSNTDTSDRGSGGTDRITDYDSTATTTTTMTTASSSGTTTTTTAPVHTSTTSTNAVPLARTMGTSTLRLTHPGVGTPEFQSVSAPITYDNETLTANNTRLQPMALMDDALIGIQTYAARRIWTKSCMATDNMKARLDDLFPHLVAEFRRLTHCETRHPSAVQIGDYFEKYSGNKEIIMANKFDSFFAWFRSMCNILKDLRHIYIQVEDYLQGLFYGRTEAEDKLKVQPEGTFLLRLASQQDGLAITYKDQNGKMKNVLLKRIDPEKYKVGKSDKVENIFNLIRSWNKLQYAYTPNKLIRKKYLF